MKSADNYTILLKKGSDYLFYKKVEITGINTATLPTLKEAERKELILKMKNGDNLAKEKLVMGNLKLVLSVMQKFSLKNNAEADDLFQVGCIGLIKALNNFDTSLDVQFSTYGVVMIMGEIKRFLRDNQTVKINRSIKDLSYKILSAKEEYILKNNEEPSNKQLAEILGVSYYQIVNALESLNPTISLHEPAFLEDSDSSFLLDKIADTSFEESFQTKIIIRDIIKNLDNREKYIISLRYLKGKTQTEVANIVGISQAQVSRIEKNVLKIVRKQFQ